MFLSFFFLSFYICFGINLNHDSLRYDSFLTVVCNTGDQFIGDVCVYVWFVTTKNCVTIHVTLLLVSTLNMANRVPYLFMFNIVSNILQCIVNDVIHHQTSNTIFGYAYYATQTNEKVRLEERNNNNNKNSNSYSYSNHNNKKQITQWNDLFSTWNDGLLQSNRWSLLIFESVDFGIESIA